MKREDEELTPEEQIALKYNLDNINAKNSAGETQLHIAAKKGNIEEVKILLDHNADVNVSDKEGCSPLRWMLLHNTRTVCSVSKQSNINEKQLYHELIKTFLSRGADLEENVKNSPISHILKFRYLDKTKDLVIKKMLVLEWVFRTNDLTNRLSKILPEFEKEDIDEGGWELIKKRFEFKFIELITNKDEESSENLDQAVMNLFILKSAIENGKSTSLENFITELQEDLSSIVTIDLSEIKIMTRKGKEKIEEYEEEEEKDINNKANIPPDLKYVLSEKEIEESLYAESLLKLGNNNIVSNYEDCYTSPIHSTDKSSSTTNLAGEKNDMGDT